MTEEELSALCREWQGILRLQDWDVKVRVVRQSSFMVPDAQGECRWVVTKKSALIQLLDPIDYPTDIEWPYDMERTLVHELMHLHSAAFDTFENGSMESAALEQMIECVADGLVRLSRLRPA